MAWIRPSRPLLGSYSECNTALISIGIAGYYTYSNISIVYECILMHMITFLSDNLYVDVYETYF